MTLAFRGWLEGRWHWPSEDGYREGGIGLPRMVIGKVALAFRGWL